MLGDLEQLQAILKDLGPAVARPNQLPQTMQEFVEVGWRKWMVLMCCYVQLVNLPRKYTPAILRTMMQANEAY